jgi:hypothetical protein
VCLRYGTCPAQGSLQCFRVSIYDTDVTCQPELQPVAQVEPCYGDIDRLYRVTVRVVQSIVYGVREECLWSYRLTVMVLENDGDGVRG